MFRTKQTARKTTGGIYWLFVYLNSLPMTMSYKADLQVALSKPPGRLQAVCIHSLLRSTVYHCLIRHPSESRTVPATPAFDTIKRHESDVPPVELRPMWTSCHLGCCAWHKELRPILRSCKRLLFHTDISHLKQCSGGDNSHNPKFHFFRFLDDLPEFNPRTTRPARGSPPPHKEQDDVRNSNESCAYPGCKSGRVATKCERPQGRMCATHCRAQGGCNLYTHRNTLPPSTSSNVVRVTYTVEIEEPSKKTKPRAK